MSVFRNPEGRVRVVWRIVVFLLLCVALAIPLGIVTAVGASAVSAIFGFDINRPKADRVAGVAFEDTWSVVGNLFLLILFLASSALTIRLMERRSFGTLGFMLTPSTIKDVGKGLLLGLVATTGIFVVEVATGAIDVQLSGEPGVVVVQSLAFYLVLFLAAGASEETFSRGYLLQVLVEGTGKIPAVLITSVMFSLLHLSNPSMTLFSIVNLALAGCVLAVAYLKTRSLWLPIGLHASWNLGLGFLCSQPVSGVPLGHTVFEVTATGPTWLTGGSFGPEGGILETLASLALIAFLLRSGTAKVDAKMAAAWETDLEEPPEINPVEGN